MHHLFARECAQEVEPDPIFGSYDSTRQIWVGDPNSSAMTFMQTVSCNSTNTNTWLGLDSDSDTNADPDEAIDGPEPL